MRFSIGFIRLTILAALLAFSVLALPQTQPSLQINSPADGTVVNPGQAVSFSVSSPSGSSFSAVGVVGEDPLDVSNVVTSLPAQFTLTIPSQLALRPYMVTASGVTGGVSVESTPLNIDVERSDMPLSLSAQSRWLTLETVGQTAPMILLATFADGSVLDVTQSTNLSYQSTNTSIATVNNTGMVTGAGGGNASITITYRNSSGPNLQLSVPVAVLPPLLTFSPSSLDFGSVNFGFSSNLSLTLTNSAASDNQLNIKAVAISGNYPETDNCVSSSPLPIGGTCTISVTFAPSTAGQNPGAITIANSSSGVPSVIPLTGVGVVAPVISNLSPNLAPSGTATNVTIAGTNFGATQGVSTVRFGGLNSNAVSWSDSSIISTVPPGLSAGNTNVDVTVDGKTSPAASFLIIPVITSLSASSGTLGTPVTIAGTSFGSSQGANTVAFNGFTSAPTSWSATSIIAPVPSQATTGPVVVTVNGIATNGVNFTVLRPTISNLSPSLGPSGMHVTIAGSNFQSTQANNTVSVGNLGASVISWSGSSILISVPNGLSAGNADVTVTVNGGASNAAAFTVLPSIAQISPTSGAVGTSVTISGTNFGNSQGTNTVTFNGVAGNPSAWSDTSITVPVPAGASSGPIAVTVNGVTSNGVNFTVPTPPPSISSLSPSSGPTGSTVTINGSNFGSQTGTAFFTQANHALVPATVITWTDTAITVTVPSTAATGNVKVLLNGLFSNSKTFTVTP